MKLAIMQPYFFPYIGYFQLVNAVDKFVFYDDVNYINRGWINRNKVLLNDKDHLITVPLAGASQNRKICEIETHSKQDKLLKKLSHAYHKAPYYKQVWPLVESIINYPTNKINILAAQSVIMVCNYLQINTLFEFSSLDYYNTGQLAKAERLIEICKINNATTYVNAIGGESLYNKEYFSNKGIKLLFLKPGNIEYKQFHNDFVGHLSIIDVLMFNSISQTRSFLSNHQLG